MVLTSKSTESEKERKKEREREVLLVHVVNRSDRLFVRRKNDNYIKITF